MMTLALIALFALVFAMVAASLADTAIRARNAHRSLRALRDGRDLLAQPRVSTRPASPAFRSPAVSRARPAMRVAA